MTAQASVRQEVLAREPADDLGPSPDFLQRPLQQVRRAQPPPQPEWIGEVDGEGHHVVGQAGGGRRVLAAELADEDPKARLGLGWRRRAMERGPVGGPDALMEPGPLRQLGQDVPQAMNGAALAVGVGPQLADRPDQARGSVADDEERAPQAASDEALAEIEPVLDPLPLTEADVEQDALAVDAEAPGDEDTLLGAVGSDRQVDRVEHEAEEADIGEAAGPERPVPIPELAADRADRGTADVAETRLSGETLDVAIGQAPDVGADDERLERSGPDDRSGVGDRRADEPGEGVADLGHGDRERTVPVAAGPVEAPGAEVGADLGEPVCRAPRRTTTTGSASGNAGILASEFGLRLEDLIGLSPAEQAQRITDQLIVGDSVENAELLKAADKLILAQLAAGGAMTPVEVTRLYSTSYIDEIMATELGGVLNDVNHTAR